MSVEGKLEVSNGGKLKISSGKLSVESSATSITFTIDILQYVADTLYQGGEYRYAVGLGTNVTYDANYLGRIDMSVQDAGDTQDQLVVSVPGAVLNDGTIDFYLYCIDNTGVGTPVFIGWSDGAESGEGGPTVQMQASDALRVEFKAGQTAVEVEMEWE